MNISMNIGLGILAGVLLLFFGRKLYWLFVGIMGFFAGMAIATRYFHPRDTLILMIVCVAIGLLGIILALFLQRLAIAVAGFFSGAYLTLYILPRIGMSNASYDWVAYIVGGIIGAIIISLLFDWALIALSSISGAVLIADVLPISRQLSLVAFVILLIIGLVFQARTLERPVRK